MSGISYADAGTTDDPVHVQHLKRRQLDNEMFMLQSDRSKFERLSNELDAEIRALEKQMTEKELELDARKAERSRMIQKVQDVDGEILRAKRAAYKK